METRSPLLRQKRSRILCILGLSQEAVVAGHEFAKGFDVTNAVKLSRNDVLLDYIFDERGHIFRKDAPDQGQHNRVDHVVPGAILHEHVKHRVE